MAAKSLQELFVEELRDTYDAEKRLIRALPKMAKAADTEELREAFTAHLEETKGQVERLEEVFATIDERPRGKKCDGMMGIIEENESVMQELEGALLDAALIAGAQKAEHYEIASYGTLAYFAELLGNERAKELLGETLEEEKATDEKLTMLAKSKVNRDALTGQGESEDEDLESMPFTSSRAPRRASSGMSLAQDRKTGGSSRSRTASGGSGSRGSQSRGSSRSRSSSSRGGSKSSRRSR